MHHHAGGEGKQQSGEILGLERGDLLTSGRKRDEVSAVDPRTMIG